MSLALEEFRPDHLEEVKAFNFRLESHGINFRLSEQLLDSWLPKKPGRRQFLEHWLVLEDGRVRGGFKLRHQPFAFHGQEETVANYQGPVSEAMIDESQFAVGVRMLRFALRQQPLLYAFGMGGTEQPLPRLLASAGWSLELIPFFFRVIRPGPFLRNLSFVRTTAARRLALDALAFSGAGSIGIRGLHQLRKRSINIANCGCVEEESFGGWADPVWESGRNLVACGALRSADALREIFPDGASNNRVLRMRRQGKDIGWAVVRCTSMRGHRQFGAMRVGSIIDNFARPGEESAIGKLATEFLISAGADLIVSNQCHSAWVAALRDNGYLRGPSNCAVALAPRLIKRIDADLSTALPTMHFTRTDGDGPIHL